MSTWNFFNDMNSFPVPYPKAVIKSNSCLERSHKSLQREMWLHSEDALGLSRSGLPVLIHFLSVPEKHSDLCLYLCWHVECKEESLRYEKRQEKELLKSQCNCRNLPLQTDLQIIS